MSPTDILESATPVARWLITLATLAYGFGPFLIDMNRTHLLHPAWPGHARFHLMWASVAQAATATLALWLVWADGPFARWRVQLALWIGIAHVGAFFVAWALARTYRGTLRDPGGMRPIAGKVDGNIIACLLIGTLLVAAWRQL